MSEHDHESRSLAALSQHGAKYGLYQYQAESAERFSQRILAAMDERDKEQQKSKYVVMGVRVAISLALAAIGATWF